MAENRLYRGAWSTHRVVEGTPVVPDASTPDKWLNTEAYGTIYFGVLFEGGASPTVDVQVLSEDTEGGGEFIMASATGVVEGGVFSAPCYSSKVLVKIAAVANAPTKVTIKALPGEQHGG
jgi:hypothetical protein